MLLSRLLNSPAMGLFKFSDWPSPGLIVRMTRREFKSGAYRLTLFALTLAVMVVCALSLSASRIENAMTRQAADLNGGDMVVTSTTIPDNTLLSLADKHGLAQSLSVRMSSMVSLDDKFQLSRIRAVDENYPLKGLITVRDDLSAELQQVDFGPAPGEAWADKPLFQKLGLSVGDIIDVGAIQLRISKVLELEPDQSGSFYSFFPKLMINRDDLDATQLIQPGSRIRVKQMVAITENTERNALAQWQNEIVPLLSVNQRLRSPKDRENRLSDQISKASAFINLGGLMSVILCGIAVSLAATRHAYKHVTQVALIRCFGLRASQINIIYTAQLLLLTLVACVVGVILGYLIHQLLISIIAELFITALPAPTIKAYFSGPLVAFVMIAGFGLPPVLQLSKTPPARILRSDIESEPLNPGKSGLIAMSSLIIIAWWQTANFSLAVITIGAALLLIGALMWLVVSLFKVWPKSKFKNTLLRSSYGNLTARPWLSAMQIVGFGLSIFAIAFILYFRTDLIQQWDQEVPDDAPNRFAFDIQTSQIDEFVTLMRENNLDNPVYPVTRGRLVEINGKVVQKPVSKENYDEVNSETQNNNESRSEAREEALTRDLALTQYAVLPFENVLTKGRWFDETDAPSADSPENGDIIYHPVSVEHELAENLDLNLDDELRFTVEGQSLYARVVSFREVNWENFQPNFYFIFPPGTLDEFSQTWLTSFYLSESQTELENTLNQQFRNSTIINVDDILQRIRHILSQVSSAMELIFAMTLFAGISIFWAAFLIAIDEKRQQTALLRALGASRSTVIKRFVLEHFLIGFFAAVLALLCLVIVGWSVSTFVLELSWTLSWPFWLLMPVLLISALCLLSYWQCRQIISRPPLSILLSG